jgi:hypothetical protein
MESAASSLGGCRILVNLSGGRYRRRRRRIQNISLIAAAAAAAAVWLTATICRRSGWLAGAGRHLPGVSNDYLTLIVVRKWGWEWKVITLRVDQIK